MRWDVDLFDVSPDGRTIAVVTNEDGISRLRLIDAASGGARPVLLPVGVIGSLDWHENGRDIGLSLSSARSPSDVYSVEAATGKVERWTESETGGLNAANFAEPELVRWPSFDGRTISGFLYKPRGEIHRPPAGRDQHPRRAGVAVRDPASSAATTTTSTSWAWRSSSPTCGARADTGSPTCCSTTAASARTRSRTSAR